MSSSKERRRRKIRDAFIGSMLIIGIAAVAGLAVWADKHRAGQPDSSAPVVSAESLNPEEPLRPAFAFIGDSYAYGERASSSTRSYPRLVCAAHNALCDVNAQVGTGYVNKSTIAGRQAFADRIQYLAQNGRAPDLIVVQGGLNDSGKADEVRAAASKTFAAIKAAFPTSKVIVVGPVITPGARAADTVRVRDAIRAATRTAGSTFLDPMAERWVTDPALFDADRVSLNDRGHKIFADRILEGIRPLVPIQSGPRTPSQASIAPRPSPGR